MKATITAILMGAALIGNLHAGSVSLICRNKSTSCKCSHHYSTTLYSTGTYKVDLRRGQVWLNLNPHVTGYYTIKVYSRSVAMSLKKCGGYGYVKSLWRKKDRYSNSLSSQLCSDDTYRLNLRRTSSRVSFVTIEISRRCSDTRIKRNSDGCWYPPIVTRSNSNFCGTRNNRYYNKRRPYHKPSYKSNKSSSRSGFGFTIKF